MANFSAQDVKNLRETTGVGMMECKKALTEADGDMTKATEILRERGLAAANKKAGRIAAEGIVAVVEDANFVVVVEVNSETDFVAQNADFVGYVGQVAQTIAKGKPADVDALLAANLDGTNETVEASLQEKILVIGEKLSIRRFARLEGAVASYVHSNKRIGVLVSFSGADSVKDKPEFAELAKDIAMQVAAVAPKYLSKDQVPAEEVEAEKKFLTEQVVKEGKPENIAEKMVVGRIGKFFQQICLEDQAFVKDGSVSVSEHITQTGKTMGADLKVVDFVRYEVGEGMEKKEDNFADEVASMVK